MTQDAKKNYIYIYFFSSFSVNPYIIFSFLREKKIKGPNILKKNFVKPGETIEEFVLQHWSDSCPLGRKTKEISLG